MESYLGGYIMRRMVGNFGSNVVFRKYGSSGRVKVVGEEVVVGVVVLLFVLVGIFDGCIKVIL